MSREFLREIEEKYGRMLESWDRTKGMDSAYQFVLPYVPPPEDFVIQGIRRPDPPKVAQTKTVQKPFRKPLKRLDAAKLGECFRCEFLDKVSAKCLLKRLKGEDACIRNVVSLRKNFSRLCRAAGLNCLRKRQVSSAGSVISATSGAATA
jgi:hypothetical protein